MINCREHFIRHTYKSCCPALLLRWTTQRGPPYREAQTQRGPPCREAQTQRGPPCREAQTKGGGISAEVPLDYFIRMGRVAVFVDAGYLFAQGSKELFGENLPRNHVRLASLSVTAKLKMFAEDNTGLNLLRIYWYDGTTGKPTQQHIELAELPNVKMRLGFINSFNQQKGVDSLIVTDMVTLAQNKAMVSCVLLAGDEDLRVGVQLTQQQGVRVHLLGIRPAKKSQSNLLRQEVDITHEWKSSDIKSFLSRVQTFPKKLPSNITSLNEVGIKVANRVPEGEVSEILSNLGAHQRIPPEYFRQLMHWGRSIIMKKVLGEDQIKEVLNAFISHLEARKAKNPESIK